MIILQILFLPVFLIIDTLRSVRSTVYKIFYLLTVATLSIAFWVNGYSNFTLILNGGLYQLGLVDHLVKVKISGASMMPIIADGSQITLHSPNKFPLERGDIVTFQNAQTYPQNYIKRIIGLPGEKVTLKNGYVFINDKALSENYTLDQLPTYGNTFLSNCYPKTVPSGQYLVLGDNRTVSMDSRVIGFVDKKDIKGVNQQHLSYDYLSGDLQNKILKDDIDTSVLVAKLNEARKSQNVSDLVVSGTLSAVARDRSESITENYTDWKKTATSVADLMAKSQYRYNNYYEFNTFGYLDEVSIVNQIFDSPRDKTSFLSANYYEIGVATATSVTGDCSFPVITIVISWPLNPSYSQNVAAFWSKEEVDGKQLLTQLHDWQNYPGVDLPTLKSITATATEMSDIASSINRQISQNEWLDQSLINKYDQLTQDLKLKIKASPLSLADNSKLKSTDNIGNSSHFVAMGPRNIEPEVTANIDAVTETSDKINITLTFTNITNKTVNISPIHAYMKNNTFGTAPDPQIQLYALGPGASKQYNFTYDKLSGGSPYTFYYVSSNGSDVKLGIYN